MSPAAGAPGGVLVYWRPGCPYCATLRLGLRGARMPAEWVNIWEDRAAAARVRAITGGDEIVPTVVVGTRAMVNPSARQVIAAVGDGQHGTRPSAGTWAAAWLARMAGFFGRGPRRAQRWASAEGAVPALPWPELPTRSRLGEGGIMRVEVSPEAARQVRRLGGRVWVWASRPRMCCWGTPAFMHAATEQPSGLSGFLLMAQAGQDGVEVWFRAPAGRVPDVLEIGLRGRRRPRVEASWDGCRIAL